MDKKNFEIIETLLYYSEEGAVTAEVILGDETIWASLNQLSSLFGRDKSVISRHIKNIFEDGELDKKSTVAKIATVQNEGEREVERKIDFYNLDIIISVGYRVNSKEATQFRIWATKILKEYIIKGYALDKELLKNGTRFGKDYFDKLLEEIREIRSSERRFYQKITDIYATSHDYNPKSELTQEFFKRVQNKLHYAISKLTAPEIVSERANSKQVNMGLTTWDNAPRGKILSKDILVAKNYLSKEEISRLNRIVSMFLDYAENQAIEKRVMYMKDWAEKLDKFLEFNEYDVLEDKGKVSRESADKIAKSEFNKFREIQDKNYISDFDKFLKENDKLLK